ncbi:cobalamin biosynthesis protein [Rhodococcus sp. SRB_17]|uniref:CobW family GTP-binding protein n=1 Tax=Rhodococcus sp. OK302 TaxID=1882769 RepID=UPI000B93AD12|nr:GTP-binding protein [Rhodococcus sp. OK302]NMM84330.1 cobalamin biosynthesis protein [Rhodococcus sp. SRB_17]OYD69288.1 G3E family GTPase [Rhodococcus sp. OK302]
MKKQIPVIVVAGFLGSGKTTLLNHLLRNNNGVRIGVIVNDFGAVNIDSMMVAGQVDSMVSLSNGCMCCAVDVSDMDEMLDKLAHRQSEIDVIVIEASGLAEPRNMIRLVLGSENPRVAYGGLVVVVDGANFRSTRRDHPELDQHVALADLLVVNKIDCIGDEDRTEFTAVIRGLNPRAPIAEATQSRIDPGLLFDAGAPSAPRPGEQLSLEELMREDHDSCGHDHVHTRYEAVDFVSAAPLDAKAVTRFLENQPAGVYRIKGYLNFEIPGYTGKFEVQTVGDHVRITPLRWKAGEPRTTQLVVIGTGMDSAAVDEALRECVRGVGVEPHPDAMLGLHRYTVGA